MRLSLLHWQHANLAKVFQRWKEYKGRRAQLFGSLIALACKWEQPLMEDAWAAWRECTTESRRIQVRHKMPCMFQPAVIQFSVQRTGKGGPCLLSGRGLRNRKGLLDMHL